jgi:DnaJ-class molecular chaperone
LLYCTIFNYYYFYFQFLRHPDKYEGTEKDKAQKVFIDIAAAKEVLTDPGS